MGLEKNNLVGNFVNRFTGEKTVRRRKALQKTFDVLAEFAKTNGEKVECKGFSSFGLSKLSDKDINLKLESMQGLVKNFKAVK